MFKCVVRAGASSNASESAGCWRFAPPCCAGQSEGEVQGRRLFWRCWQGKECWHSGWRYGKLGLCCRETQYAVNAANLLGAA